MPQSPGYGDADQLSSPSRDDVTPKRLSQSGRSKTAPLDLNHLWTPSVDQPQLSERDSIFATTYLPSDSPAPSPRTLARTTQPDDHVEDQTRSDMAVNVSTLRRLTAASTPRHQQTQQPPSSLKEAQSLLSARFNSSRKHQSDMSFESMAESPPPFMSPVDSPVHRPTTPASIIHHTTSLDDTLAESDTTTERLKNRMWRVGNAEAFLQHSGHAPRKSGHVDKKIEATFRQFVL